MRLDVVVMLLGWAAGWWLLWRVPRLAARAGTRRSGDEGPPSEVDITVLIPARNEELSLPHLLESLMAQTVRPRQIVVVDDGSTDRTAAVARSYPGVTVVEGEELPPGWTGKAWACSQGAARADGERLVFLDADVRLAPDGLEAVLTHHDRHGGLVSVQPYHRMERAYERLSAMFNLVGIMGVGMASPGRDGRARAAFGPCVVCSRHDYEAIGGHEAVRGEIIEDIALGRTFAKAGYPVHAYGGGDQVAFRMYPGGLGQLVEGWSKNMASGAGAAGVVRTAAVALWITAVFASIVNLIEWVAGTGDLGALDVGLGWLLFVVQFAVMLRQVGNFRAWPVLAFPVTVAMFVVVFLRSLWLTLVRRRVSWRGRPIPLSGSRRWRRVPEPGGA
ncbi:MAG: glycosyltransferase [Acidimicrobiia bacterium]|nr:glycosyltransferase [Acidimicrobiia bacterium]